MRCSKALPLLAKQLREPLGLPEAEALRQHLAACPGCRSAAAELQAFDATLLQERAAEAPRPAVRVDTAAIFQAQPKRRGATPWLPAVAVSAGLAAVSMVWLMRPVPALRATPEQTVRALPQPQPQPHRSPRHMAVLPVEPSVTHAPKPGLRPDLTSRTQPPVPVRPVVALRQHPARPTLGPMLPAGLPALQVRAAEQRVSRERVLTIAFAPPPEPAEESGPTAAAFRGDDRLGARLVLTEKDRPLGELLTQLSARLRVRLTTGREVADDKLTLFLRERSAAEALTLAARHLGFKWRRAGEGYELRQDLASRQREQALLRNELQPIETQLNLAARWLPETTERKKERVAEIDALIKGRGLGAEEQARLEAEMRTVTDTWLEPARVDASLMLFRSLSPAQIDSVLGGGEFRYSTANGTLPALVATRIYDSTATLERIYGPLARVQADVTLSLSDVEDLDELPPARRNRQLLLRTQFSTIRGTKEEPHYWGAGWAPPIPAPALPHPDGMVTDPDLQRAVELALPGPERQPPVITGGSMICAAQLGAVWPRRATLADVAEAIQRASGLEVVADSFVSARLDPALLRGRRPLAEILQKVAEELDYTWEKRGKLLLLRDRRFYRDRPAEVPERLLQPFRTRVTKQGALTLDELADLAARLSDTQARGMYRYWGWYLEDTGILPTDYFFGHRQHLRFWASLNPAQRGMLRQGGALPVADLLPGQRQLWADALTSPPENARTPSDAQRIPTAAEIALGSFKLRITENQAALFVTPSMDGKRQTATSVIVEGPANYDTRKLMQSEPGSPPLESAGPPLALAGYSFQYYVGGAPEPLRTTRILIAPPQKPAPTRPGVGPTPKE